MFKLINDTFEAIVIIVGWIFVFLVLAIPIVYAYQYYPSITLWVGGFLAFCFCFAFAVYIIELIFDVDLIKKMEEYDKKQEQRNQLLGTYNDPIYQKLKNPSTKKLYKFIFSRKQNNTNKTA